MLKYVQKTILRLEGLRNLIFAIKLEFYANKL